MIDNKRKWAAHEGKPPTGGKCVKKIQPIKLISVLFQDTLEKRLGGPYEPPCINLGGFATLKGIAEPNKSLSQKKRKSIQKEGQLADDNVQTKFWLDYGNYRLQ